MQRRFIAAAVAAFTLPLSSFADDLHVIVTANRFDETDRKVAANVVTIDREEIARTPTATLPELLATRAGFDFRSLYGSLAADASASLRGFGENGGLRTLVLVDGRRLDSLDFTSPYWGAIPLESIERIEIVRGSGAVMYGDQAVAGVINIITNRGREPAADVAVTAGSFGYGQVDGNLSTSLGAHRIVASVEHVESNEYRRNNEHRSTAASGRVSHDIAGGEVFVDAGASTLRYGLPGAVTEAQYASNPRAAETTDSWFKRDHEFFRPGVRKDLTPNLTMISELEIDDSRNRSWISNWGSYRDVGVRSYALTPRLRWAHGLAGVDSTTVAGVDWSDAKLDQDIAATPGGATTDTVSFDRRSLGAYVHNTTQATDTMAITAGVRAQRISTHATNTAATSGSDTTASKPATELGAIWRPSAAWKVFAKAATTFRYPVLDELTTFGGFALPPPRPETGKEVDLGTEWRGNGHSIQATLYEQRMRDEITYNAITFQNENLQRTLHRGIEVDTRWQVAAAWHANLSWTQQQAEFTEGANDGKTIPLVPRTKLTAMLTWDGAAVGTHSLLASYVGSRHFVGDEANTRTQLPAYTTLDWKSRWQFGHWNLDARIANLTNRKYATYALDYGYGASYYPANPRAGYVTARYRF
ncbi:MAG TPA: TonB-dependent receptor [Rhodocyclaceae bacterium]|nr:TonB-dependent receptor [Rhodocyclaceae bacterium]